MSAEAASEADGLAGRQLASAVNPPEILAAHKARMNGKVRTRFPPEPNGYLHIGHAKSMFMNFHMAFEKMGVPKENRETVFRYDDTNPDKESQEYIDSIAEDVKWMGWTPVKVTHASDLIPTFYELAIKLIKNGKAYVCHQTKADIEASRNFAKDRLAGKEVTDEQVNSPYRNRSVEENLREFEKMRQGRYARGTAALRFKMDMTSPNPNMWDQVAYRIKYVPHPHAGDAWCIYPTYDFVHCVQDSLEDVDYSLCTLEFESRRESYYWVLEALDMWRPSVYEFSRLNITYTMMSKRRLLKMVTTGMVRGWDDPRMPTIKGLRRRGFTASILNNFCAAIGVTRKANTIQMELLEHYARQELHETSKRALAVLEPVRVVLTNLDPKFSITKQAPDFPFAPERGSHDLTLKGNVVYIDMQDFKKEDEKGFYGMAPGKAVLLKYMFPITCDKFVTNADGSVKEIHATADAEFKTKKPKGVLTWACAQTSAKAEVRVYTHAFTDPEPTGDDWESKINPKSEVVYKNARVEPSVIDLCAKMEGTGKPAAFQLERLGFFVLDSGDGSAKNLVFNRTVSLKASTTDAKKSQQKEGRSRKAEQDKAAADKAAKLKLSPEQYFREGETGKLYSQWDKDHVPTHDAAGEKLSKSSFKKLKKELAKHSKAWAKTQK